MIVQCYWEISSLFCIHSNSIICSKSPTWSIPCSLTIRNSSNADFKSFSTQHWCCHALSPEDADIINWASKMGLSSKIWSDVLTTLKKIWVHILGWEVFQGVYNEISESLSYVSYFLDSWNGLLITNSFPYKFTIV